MYGQRPHLPVESAEENGAGGFANGAPGWWARGEGGGYMNVVAHHPQQQAAYHHEQSGFDPQTCINLKGFEFSDLDHALLGEDPAMRSHAARLHQLSSQSQHGHPGQGYHQDVSYHPQTGGIVHGDPTGKFPTYQRSEYHAQQIQGGERHQLYRNGNGANYSQFVGMHPNVALKHHPRNAAYQGLPDMPPSIPGQFVQTQENEAAARTQPADHWQHRNFPNQGMAAHAQLQNNNAAMDSFEKIAQTELRMRMLYAQQSAAAQQRSMLSPGQASAPSPVIQKPCAAAGAWQPAPLVSRSSSISSTHSNLSGTSGQCFSPCMQTPTPIPQSPCGPVPQSPCQAQHPPHRSPNLSSLRAVQEEGARWSCEQPTQVMQQTVSQQGPAETPNPLLERQAWELQQQRTGSVVLNNVEREQCTAWSPNFSAEQQHNVLPNHHLQGEENVFSSQDGLQVGYNPSLPKVEREVEIPRLQMASPPVPYQMDMSRLEAKDQNFQRQIQIVQNTAVEGGGYPYQQEQPVPESPSFQTRHGDQFYPGFNTQSGLSIPAVSVNNTEGPKEVLPQDLVVPPSQEQRLSHPVIPMVVEHTADSVDSKAAPNFLWPSDDVSNSKSEQVLSNSSQVPPSIVNNYREAASDLPDAEPTRPRTQNVLAALSTACHNLITNLQRSTYSLYETVGKEERAQAALEHGGMTWDGNEHIVSQDVWKGEVDEVPGLTSVVSNDEIHKVPPVFNHTDDSLSQTSCNGAGLSTRVKNEAAPTVRKRRASEDNVPTKGKKQKNKVMDTVEQRQNGNEMADVLLDRENNDFNSTFATQDGITQSTDSTGRLNPATLQNTDTSLHLTIVNGNVYPAAGPNLQPAPVVETPQVAEIQEETTTDSSEAKVCEGNLQCDGEGSVTQSVTPLYTQQRSLEACQSENEFEGKCVAGYSQDDQSAQELENSAFVKSDQEDRSAGDSRPVAGEDRHPLEILQAQIRLQQQQFNLAPSETTSSRPSSAPCTTDSKEALLDDTWYQASSPGPDDANRAPWEKNRDKMIKLEELEPGSVDRRLLHKLNEQRRRDSLKSAIYCLKQAIPDCRDSSDQSQQNVLNKANNFILEMLDKQRQADQCREEVRNLRARNLALQQGISALQTEYTHLSKHP